MSNVKKNIIDFLTQINFTGGCWEWEGERGAEGTIISFWIDNEPIVAQEFSYELFFGKLTQDGMLVNLCNNPNCVNPLHLKFVSYEESEKIKLPGVGVMKEKKTHCPQGHELKEPNLINGQCRICFNIFQQMTFNSQEDFK